MTLKKKDRELYPAHDPLIFAIYFLVHPRGENKVSAGRMQMRHHHRRIEFNVMFCVLPFMFISICPPLYRAGINLSMILFLFIETKSAACPAGEPGI
ncbi:MAG: hypothetical protein WC799_12505 [Desulfobacteraceae bacterium]